MTEVQFDEFGFPVPSTSERVFRLQRKSSNSGGLWIAGGIAALVFALFGFLVSLVSHVDQFSMQAITTLPALIGISAIAMGKMMAKTPWEVGVGPDGIRMEYRDGTKT